MGLEAESKVPTIDLSTESLKPGTEAWTSNCKLMRFALEKFGYFLVVYDKVSLQLHESLFEATEQLFNLPTETKAQETSEKTYHGYFGGISYLPLYESMGIDNPTSLQGAHKFTNLMWPAGNHRFCEIVHDFSKLAAKLEEMVTKMLFDSYGVSRLCESSIESTAYLLRCFSYRMAENEEANMGLHPHIDLTFFSLIHQHLISGLQVESPAGEWIDIPPLGHSSFVVMAGEALAAWSNGRIRPCKHRVVLKEKKQQKQKKKRYSVGLFSFKKETIEVPEELVDEVAPLKYKPFEHFEYLRFHKENSLRKIGYSIKDYCGV